MPRASVPGRLRTWRARVVATTALTSAALLASEAMALPGPAVPDVRVEAGGGAPVIASSAPGGGVSAQMDVTLNAQRTQLRWETFDVGSTELLRFLFPSRGAIVLNQVTGQAVIDGRLEGRVGSAFGGNVWIASANGVVFGANARVDVGGLLATTSTSLPENFFNPSAAPTFDFFGASAAAVEVRGGAQITGHGGTLAFVSQEVRTQAGAVVQGAAADPGDTSVAYAAMGDFRITFAPSSANDLDLVGFALTPEQAGSSSVTPLTLAGATTAGAIQIVALSQPSVVNAVISVPGLQVARRAVSGAGGDILLLAGTDPAAGYGLTNVGSAAAPIGELRADNRIDGSIHGSGYFSTLQAGTAASVSTRDGDLSVDRAVSTGDILLTSTIGDVFLGSGQARDDILVRAVNGSARVRSAAFEGAADADRDGAGPDTAGDGHRLLVEALFDPGLVPPAPPPPTTPPTTPPPPPPPPPDSSLGGALADDRLEPDHAVVLAPAAFGIVTSVFLGEGVGAVTGADRIEVRAPDGLATVDLTAPARLDLVQAGGLASVRAPSVEVRSIIAGDDALVTATNGQALVASAVAADDIIVSATGGAARLQSATLNAGSSDDDADGPGPDLVGDGRRVLVQAGAGADAALGEGLGTVTGAARIDVLAGRNADVDVTGGLAIDRLEAGTGSATARARAGDMVVRQGQAGQDLSISAPAGLAQAVAVTAGRSFALSGRTVALGSLGGALSGDVTITATAGGFSRDALTAGGAITIDVAGPATFGRLTAGTVRIAATDLSLTDSLTTRRAQFESRGGPLVLGDNVTGVAQGMFISAAEFNRIQAAERVDFYAGLTTPAQPGGDILVGDLAFNPQRAPTIGLFAGAANDVRILRAFTPTTSGGTLLVGDEAANTVWRPRSIQLTGSLGSAQVDAGGVVSNAITFNDVRLSARQDIFIGSPRFVTLASGTAPAQFDIARDQPQGVAPIASEQNRVFLAAGRLSLRAPGRIVQQNTASAAGRFAGLYLANTAGTPGAVLFVNEPAAVIDLFGSYVRRTGALASGRPAALGVDLVLGAGVAPGSAYRFNGCLFPTGANCADQAPPIFRMDFANQSFANFNWPLDALRADYGAPLLSLWNPDRDDEERPDPIVTGAGNEEIWRTPK